MDNLRWWLLLIAAVMFSMSGCASSREWTTWREHPTHFASNNHMTFSARAGNGDEAAITEVDKTQAGAEGWWGAMVPGDPPANLSGRWVGTWKGVGLFDSLRQASAEATLVQQGAIGVAHLHLDNTIAAGVPWIFRLEGSRGVRLVYRVSGNDAMMRHVATPGELTGAFTLVDGRLIGTLPNPDGPVVVTLVRQDK
jgi:hypothetical protein